MSASIKLTIDESETLNIEIHLDEASEGEEFTARQMVRMFQAGIVPDKDGEGFTVKEQRC